MEKSLIDYLIKKTARKLEIDEKIVDKVVRHQWRHAHKMAQTKNQIEITGIGYFYTSSVKIKRKIGFMENTRNAFTARALDEPENAEKYLKYVEDLNNKINDMQKRLKFHESRLERISSRSVQQSDGPTVD